MNIRIINTITGLPGKFPKHLMKFHPEFKEVKEAREVEKKVAKESNVVELRAKELSYSELKAKATELGIEFKGNISKAKLAELINKTEE